ncbi:MAG: hypothetical protein VB096_01615 [Pseudoflavonifractor sp.]|nr:hypothetical protein [Pseudoflavonifractor sp.]
MFNFLQSNQEEKKEISRLLDNAYARGLPAYQREMGALLDEAEASGKTDLTREAKDAMNRYLERIAVTIESAIRKAENEEIRGRYNAAKADHSLAGALIQEEGAALGAGNLFQLLYYAYTGKKAGAKDIQRQDFLLGAYVDRALNQLQRPI